jgi:hypothetical protein
MLVYWYVLVLYIAMWVREYTLVYTYWYYTDTYWYFGTHWCIVGGGSIYYCYVGT